MKIPDSLQKAAVLGGIAIVIGATVAYGFAGQWRTKATVDEQPLLAGGTTCICDNDLCGTTTAHCGPYEGLDCSGGNEKSQAHPDISCPLARACPADPSNGSYGCDGTSTDDCDYHCVLSCSAGYHVDQCSSTATTCDPDSPSACGPSCTACPAPANSTPFCSNATCGFTCNAGYHNCGGICVQLSADSCGDSCTECATGQPPNSSDSCSITTGTGSGGVCQYFCNSGFHNCGGSSLSCAALGVTSCGDSCANCTSGAPGNSSATSCSNTSGSGSGGVCDCACNAGYWPAGVAACASLSCTSQSFTTNY